MDLAIIRPLCTAVLGGMLLFLGPFVLMAESGGKDSEPLVLVPLLLALFVLGFGVKVRGGAHADGTSLLSVLTAVSAGAPLVLSSLVPGREWAWVFGGCWLAALGFAVVAAVVSRRPVSHGTSGDAASPPAG